MEFVPLCKSIQIVFMPFVFHLCIIYCVNIYSINNLYLRRWSAMKYSSFNNCILYKAERVYKAY